MMVVRKTKTSETKTQELSLFVTLPGCLSFSHLPLLITNTETQ